MFVALLGEVRGHPQHRDAGSDSVSCSRTLQSSVRLPDGALICMLLLKCIIHPHSAQGQKVT